MPNLGNIGMRWHNRKVSDAVIEGDKVRVTLECGHSYSVGMSYGSTPESTVVSYRARIGKRERCKKCVVAQ